MTANSYHHGALHEAILQAAVDAARRGGPRAVGIRVLAKAAGVSPSAVYRHVPSIDALIAEVAQVVRQQLAGHLITSRDLAPRHRTRKATARERFRAIGRGYIEFALAEPHLFDTAFTPVSDPPPRPDDPSAWGVLVGGVAELVDVGLIAPGAADEAALIAWAAVQGIASILVRNAVPAPISTEEATEVILDAVMVSLETL